MQRESFTSNLGLIYRPKKSLRSTTLLFSNAFIWAPWCDDPIKRLTFNWFLRYRFILNPGVDTIISPLYIHTLKAVCFLRKTSCKPETSHQTFCSGSTVSNVGQYFRGVDCWSPREGDWFRQYLDSDGSILKTATFYSPLFCNFCHRSCSVIPYVYFPPLCNTWFNCECSIPLIYFKVLDRTHEDSKILHAYMQLLANIKSNN